MKIIAHRGASSYAPENTLAAFQKALDFGADGIELDVRLSKDDIPVICHDASINRTSNGKGYIHELTVAELREFHFYGKFKREFSKERIPTLEDVLKLIGDKPITLNIELKNVPYMPKNLEHKVLELVYKYNFRNRVIYSSFDHELLARLQKLDPTARIGLIFHMNLVNFFDYIDLTELDLYSIHPNYFYLTEEIVAEVKRRGIKTFIYTVNNPTDARHFASMGVDELITNNPLLLI